MKNWVIYTIAGVSAFSFGFGLMFYFSKKGQNKTSSADGIGRGRIIRKGHTTIWK